MTKIGEESLKYYSEITTETNWRLRANIALVAGNLVNSELAHNILKQLAADSDSNVRNWVASAVSDRSDTKAEEILSILLHHSH